MAYHFKQALNMKVDVAGPRHLFVEVLQMASDESEFEIIAVT